MSGAYRPVLLGSDEAALRAHPDAGVWSILEYSCHLRDVLTAQRDRIRRALEEDNPDFASMRREERVAEERYNEQQPEAVADQLDAAAGALAGVVDSLDDAGWRRTGIYHWPATRVRTVEWIARHGLHECVHHLMDVSK
jgi:hypothetical protein